MEWRVINGVLLPNGPESRSYLAGIPNDDIIELEPPKQETGITKQQRKAVHKYLRLLAIEFIEHDIGMKALLSNKPEVEIMPTMQQLKESIWKPLCEALFKVESSEDLEPGQVNKVYEALDHWTSETYGISIRFPDFKNLAK